MSHLISGPCSARAILPTQRPHNFTASYFSLIPPEWLLSEFQITDLFCSCFLTHCPSCPTLSSPLCLHINPFSETPPSAAACRGSSLYAHFFSLLQLLCPVFSKILSLFRTFGEGMSLLCDSCGHELGSLSEITQTLTPFAFSKYQATNYSKTRGTERRSTCTTLMSETPLLHFFPAKLFFLSNHKLFMRKKAEDLSLT